MDEVVQLKAIWFDIEMKQRALAQQKPQVEAKIRELMTVQAEKLAQQQDKEKKEQQEPAGTESGKTDKPE